MFKILSTKILEPGMVPAAREIGMEVVEQEFISIKAINSEWIFRKICTLTGRNKIATLAFTSANAVKAVVPYMNRMNGDDIVDWDIFCLSGKTKQTLLDGQWLRKNIAGEAADAASLARKVIEQQVTEIIFFCGDQRRDELPDTLKAAGVQVHELVVYQTIETPVVTEEMDAVLFFSPSAVNSFFSANQPKAETVCFAIGDTTAAAIRKCTGNRVIVSDAPTQSAMLASLKSYFQTKNRTNE